MFSYGLPMHFWMRFYIIGRYACGNSTGGARIIPVKGWCDIAKLKKDGVIL